MIAYDDPADAWVDDDTLLEHCLFWLAKPAGRAVSKFSCSFRTLHGPVTLQP